MKFTSLLCALFCIISIQAQNIEINATTEIAGLFSNDDENPFWTYRNTNRTFGAGTSLAVIGDVEMNYAIGNANLSGGVAGYYRNGVSDEFQRRDLYVGFENSWLRITAGAKKQEEVLNGLTTSNKNFLWSGNARPLPGLLIEANEPVRISNTFSIDWGLGHYVLNDDRYVDNPRVHYKRLQLNVNLSEKSMLKARLQHFAQWAGTSPTEGKLLSNLGAYYDVFLAKRSDQQTEVGEQINAIGNHLGSYFLEYNLSTQSSIFSVYHEHPFEDGSGTRLANFPDGIWGISLEMKEPKLLDAIVYEYVDTSDQSGDTSMVSGSDGYFGNGVYRSGWTYEDQVIGLPFILLDPEVVINDRNSKFTSNRTRAHHLGATGTYKRFAWKAKASYVTFLGRFQRPFDPEVNAVFTYASLQYNFDQWGQLRAFTGFDISNVNDTIIAAGLSYSYLF
ncbi:MAG: hypothetical protein HKM28_03970 [Flavobacteriaceae bacterium]|nr:hypothetical protein [Flavobacteriaceae bacterium]